MSAGIARTQASQVAQALGAVADERETGRQIPDYPPECRRKHRSGVAGGDRQDVALVKTDNALWRHQRQTDVCAAWFDDWKAGIEVGVQ